MVAATSCENRQFLIFTQSQEKQKTIDIAAMLVSQTKEIIKFLLLRVHYHGCHDVRWKPAVTGQSLGLPVRIRSSGSSHKLEALSWPVASLTGLWEITPNYKIIESLSTETFLHDGGVFSVSRLETRTAFLARIFYLSSARITTTDARRVKRREN